MERAWSRFVLGLAAVVLAAAATASEVQLNVIQFPERRGVAVPFGVTERAPLGASLTADVEARGAQTQVELNFKNLQPALLLGGQINSYVLWAATREGNFQNLGEIPASQVSGYAKFQTGLKEFAMFVTAEPFPTIWRPSDMLVFLSGQTRSKYAKSGTFSFSAFGKAARADRDSVGTGKYDGNEPIELVQARRIYETAKDAGVEKFDVRSMSEAATTLAQADNSARGGSSRAVTDYTRRTVALVSSAASNMIKTLEEKAKAEAAAKRKAELEALAQKASTAEEQKDVAERAKAAAAAEAAALAMQKSQLQEQMAALMVERNAIAAEKESVQKERDALAARLEGTLGSIAQTTRTARGLLVNLPGVFFDTGQATLKSLAQITLAKLSTLLQLYPQFNIRIEGYTDSTGGEEMNMKLSRDRALTVFDFLKDNGVVEARMKYEGYGPQFPVADNKTNEGRARNRRVEVILAEGEIGDAASAQSK